MIFSSLDFLGFFVAYFLAALFMPKRMHLLLLILASLIFYSWWKVEYVLIPIVISGGIYLACKVLEKNKFSRTSLLIAIAVLLLPLIFFKYTNFLLGRDVVGYNLPIGISFITFSGIAYVIDYYRGSYRQLETFPTILGYIVYFPQLVAGPILRPGELISQIRKPLRFSYHYLCLGAFIFSVGVFKKIFIADQISPWVNDFYTGEIAFSLQSMLIAVYGFSVQIYCDFSGYTDMATGVAFALGVRLPLNFDRPYMSKSIAEFWRRWHMTLSRWFRDYVYIPLGGGRAGGHGKLLRNLLITFGLSGLWHGAGLNFIAWGLITGLLIWFCRIFPLSEKLRIPNALRVFLTFNLVTLLWVLFRDKDFYLVNTLMETSFDVLAATSHNAQNLIYPTLLIVITLIFHPWDNRFFYTKIYRKIGSTYSLSLACFIILATIIFNTDSSAEFIYFDF